MEQAKRRALERDRDRYRREVSDQGFTSTLRHRQPRSPLRLEHEKEIGEVIALDRDQAGHVHAVCITDRVDLLRDFEPWYFSSETNSTSDHREVRNNWRPEGATRDRVERAGVRWRTQQM